MSMSDEEAVAAIRTHHAELQADLRERVTALEDSVRRGEWHGDVQRSLVEYLDGELLPHASAEERALYPAGDSGLTGLLVRAMRDEHRTLIAHVSELRTATDAVAVAATAAAILALFESHLTKENDLLLPALAADESVDVGSLLAGMHELVG
jgi:iron-sulfur cluster repair protein YtfE (RIC family)